MEYLNLNKLSCYNRAFELSNFVWGVVLKWDYFSQRVVGIQFCTAVDSISANIAEGFGRYHKKDKIKFYRYSQGSLQESIDWCEKSYYRKVLSEKDYAHIISELNALPKELNYLIKFTSLKLKS